MLARSEFSIRLSVGLAMLIIWECVASLVGNPRLAPHSWQLLTLSLPSFALFNGDIQIGYLNSFKILIGSALITITRALAGLVIGGIAGVLIGLTAHFYQDQRKSQKILLSMIRSAPLFSLLPLWLYWFTGNQAGIVSYISFAVFVFMATSCFEAILDVSQSYIWQAQLLGANRKQIFIGILLPAIAPSLAKSFRWIIGLLMAFSLGAEYLSSDSSGLGWLVYRCYVYSNCGQLLILCAIYALLGGMLIGVFDRFLFRLQIFNHTT